MQQTVAGRNCENQTLTNETMTQELEQYMTEQVRLLANAKYTTISISATNIGGKIDIYATAYAGKGQSTQFAPNIPEAIAKALANDDGRSESQIKRDKAVELLAEADALDAAEAMENQTALPL
jgi:hypothetical protein